jgi:cystathionine beta-synthase
MNMARTLVRENEGWFDVDQYDNLDNPEGHYRTLGPEIWMQTEGRITHFVMGGSTGGTISGVGKFLKSMKPG